MSAITSSNDVLYDRREISFQNFEYPNEYVEFMNHLSKIKTIHNIQYIVYK